jgi:HSP20 family molecular chaperone IbpA
VKPSRMFGGFGRPEISGETEPLVDMTSTDNEVKAVVEMAGIRKDKIKINAFDNTVEVESEDPQRKYHRTFEIPPERDIKTAKSTYNNGILEITFKKNMKAVQACWRKDPVNSHRLHVPSYIHLEEKTVNR